MRIKKVFPFAAVFCIGVILYQLPSTSVKTLELKSGSSIRLPSEFDLFRLNMIKVVYTQFKSEQSVISDGDENSLLRLQVEDVKSHFVCEYIVRRTSDGFNLYESEGILKQTRAGDKYDDRLFECTPGRRVVSLGRAEWKENVFNKGGDATLSSQKVLVTVPGS